MKSIFLCLTLFFFSSTCFGQFAEDFINKGIAKANLKDYLGAVEEYTKALNVNPYNIYAFYNRANAKFNLKNYHGAIEDYNKVVEINPTLFNNECYFYRAKAKYNLKDYIGAIQDYTKVLESDPKNAEAYYFRGWSKSMLNDNRGAIVDFDKAIENSQIRIGSYYTGRGWSKYNLGTSYAEKITKNNAPSQNGTQFNERDLMAAQIDENSRANAWGGTASSTYDKALERQRQAAVEREKSNSQNQQINAQNAEASAQSMKYYRGAIIDFTTAIEINEKDVYAYIGRAFIKLNLGDTNGACTDWSKAGELGDEKSYEYIKEYCQ